MKAACERCLLYEVDDAVACEACGARADERSRALGSAVLALVGVAYLAALAIAYLVFRARPFVGGMAAIAALLVGRALPSIVRVPTVTRRPSQSRLVAGR